MSEATQGRADQSAVPAAAITRRQHSYNGTQISKQHGLNRMPRSNAVTATFRSRQKYLPITAHYKLRADHGKIRLHTHAAHRSDHPHHYSSTQCGTLRLTWQVRRMVPRGRIVKPERLSGTIKTKKDAYQSASRIAPCLSAVSCADIAEHLLS